MSVDPSLRNLNDCGCGEGTSVQTPMEVTNRPGLRAVSYRVGTYTQFKQSMLSRLSTMDSSALRRLQTRADDDFSIALLDSWAMVSDVLTFYQERIANESYLRTAREQLSLTYLARGIGYELRSGVAATTYLAFTIEDAPGTPGRTSVDVGTKVQSLPNPGEQPQIFETVETIDDARATWNAIKPRQVQTQQRLLAAPPPVQPAVPTATGTDKTTPAPPAPKSPPASNGNAPKTSNTSSGNAAAAKAGDTSASTKDAGTDTGPDQTLFLDGIATGLKLGDGLLIMPQTGDSSHAVFYQIMTITPQPAQKWTKVELQKLSYAQPGPAVATPAPVSPPPQPPPQLVIPQLPPMAIEVAIRQLQMLLAFLPPTPITAVLELVLTLLPPEALAAVIQTLLNALPELISFFQMPPDSSAPAAVPATLSPDALANTLPQAILAAAPENVLTALPPVTLSLLQPHMPEVTDTIAATTDGVSPATMQMLKSSTTMTVSASSVRMNGTTAISISTYSERTIDAVDTHAIAQLQNFHVREVLANVKANKPDVPTVYAFRVRASIFGHNAPAFKALSVSQRIGDVHPGGQPPSVDQGPYFNREQTWVDAPTTLATYPNPDKEPTPDAPGAYLYLDNAYQSIVKDSWIVLRDSDGPSGSSIRPYKVADATELTKSDFALTAKVSRLVLDTNDGLDLFTIRKTTVFAQSEELKLANVPLIDPATRQPTTDPTVGQPQIDPSSGDVVADQISGLQIDLDTAVDGLMRGQKVVICGELQGQLGTSICELATIASVEQVYPDMEGAYFTRITFEEELKNAYVNNTVTINANVALATHGDTVQSEVLGSGDASLAYQRFTLRKGPLTYIAASTPGGTGMLSTLKVYVNDIEWREAQTLYGHGPRERIFVTRIDDNGKTIVQFGDGHTGVRLPTGQENVRATYRTGSGSQGAVRAGQLSLLLIRPLGVKSVTNPFDAAGYEEGEAGEDARLNAPVIMQTLDRLVSLQDYEKFAQAYPGIAKAAVSKLWTNQGLSVFVTVAPPKGLILPDDAPLYNGLLLAMQSMSEAYVPLHVQSYQLALFRIAARVKVNPIYAVGEVLKAAVQAMQQNFSFDARAFGQPVTLSEVIVTLQDATGVVAVDVYRFYRYDPTLDTEPAFDTAPSAAFPPPPQQLNAAPPTVNADGTVSGAELLLVNVAHLEIWE